MLALFEWLSNVTVNLLPFLQGLKMAAEAPALTSMYKTKRKERKYSAFTNAFTSLVRTMLHGPV